MREKQTSNGNVNNLSKKQTLEFLSLSQHRSPSSEGMISCKDAKMKNFLGNFQVAIKKKWFGAVLA